MDKVNNMNGIVTKANLQNDINKYMKILVDINLKHSIYCRLIEKLNNEISFKIMNDSKAYYQIILSALVYNVKVRLNTLLDDDTSSKNIFKLVRCVESNQHLFNYKGKITGTIENIDSIGKALIRINQHLNNNLEKIKMLKLNRDKTLVHLDKKFFENPRKLSEHVNLNTDDFSELIILLKTILNMFSFFLDGTVYDIECEEIEDIENVFNN